MLCCDKAANDHATKKLRCTRRRALRAWHCITERLRYAFVGYTHIGLADHELDFFMNELFDIGSDCQ
jgi:hypothetical protein